VPEEPSPLSPVGVGQARKDRFSLRVEQGLGVLLEALEGRVRVPERQERRWRRRLRRVGRTAADAARATASLRHGGRRTRGVVHRSHTKTTTTSMDGQQNKEETATTSSSGGKPPRSVDSVRRNRAAGGSRVGSGKTKEKNCHPALTFARQLFKIPGDRMVARLAPGTFVPTRRTGASRPTQHRSKQTNAFEEEGEMMAPDSMHHFFCEPRAPFERGHDKQRGHTCRLRQHFETASSDLSVGS
jgi:hypothetical protein